MLPETKRNLLDSLDRSVKSVEGEIIEGFPKLEIEDIKKPRSYSEPPQIFERNQSSPKLDIVKVDSKISAEIIDNNVTKRSDDSHDTSVEFTVSSLEKSYKSLNLSKDSAEEQEEIPPGRPRGLTVDGLCNIRTNWEDLYKKEEPVSDGKESGIENEVMYTRIGNVGEGSDPGELIKQGVYPSRENLSIKFDEGDAALAQSEEGLAALCVGKCMINHFNPEFM